MGKGRPGRKPRGSYRFGSRKKSERVIRGLVIKRLCRDVTHLRAQQESISTTPANFLLKNRNDTVVTLRRVYPNSPQARILEGMSTEEYRRHLIVEWEAKIAFIVKRLHDEFDTTP